MKVNCATRINQIYRSGVDIEGILDKLITHHRGLSMRSLNDLDIHLRGLNQRENNHQKSASFSKTFRLENYSWNRKWL